jgi:hypothetical protein
MVVQNSVTFSVTRIGSQVDRSKAINYIRTGQHLLLPSVKIARHMSSVHHNWSLLKSDRFSLQNTLPVSIMVGPLMWEVDYIGFTTPVVSDTHGDIPGWVGYGSLSSEHTTLSLDGAQG